MIHIIPQNAIPIEDHRLPFQPIPTFTTTSSIVILSKDLHLLVILLIAFNIRISVLAHFQDVPIQRFFRYASAVLDLLHDQLHQLRDLIRRPVLIPISAFHFVFEGERYPSILMRILGVD
jgi:hypothetical protein